MSDFNPIVSRSTDWSPSSDEPATRNSAAPDDCHCRSEPSTDSTWSRSITVATPAEASRGLSVDQHNSVLAAGITVQQHNEHLSPPRTSLDERCNIVSQPTWYASPGAAPGSERLRKNSHLLQACRGIVRIPEARVVDAVRPVRGLNASRHSRLLQIAYTQYIIDIPIMGSRIKREQAIVWVPGGLLTDGRATTIDVCTGSCGHLTVGNDYSLELRELDDGTFMVLKAKEVPKAAHKFQGPTELSILDCKTIPLLFMGRWFSSTIPAATFHESFVSMSHTTFEATKSFNPDRITTQTKTAAVDKWGALGSITWSDGFWPPPGDDPKYPMEPVFETFDFLDSVDNGGQPANGIELGIQAGDIEFLGPSAVLQATTRVTFSNRDGVGRGDWVAPLPSPTAMVHTCTLQKLLAQPVPEIRMARIFVRAPKPGDAKTEWNNSMNKAISYNFLWLAMHEFGHALGLYHLPRRDYRCGQTSNMGLWQKDVMTQTDDAPLTWDALHLDPGTTDAFRLGNLYPTDDAPSSTPKAC